MPQVFIIKHVQKTLVENCSKVYDEVDFEEKDIYFIYSYVWRSRRRFNLEKLYLKPEYFRYSLLRKDEGS